MATKKNQKKIIEYDGIIFDSNEELEFYHWVIEAEKYKFISSWKYNIESFLLSPKQTYTVEKKLKTKTKIVDKHLFNSHQYSPDFIIYKGENWNLIEDKVKLISLHNEREFVIDVKGTFQRNDGARSFSINQKWMFDKYNIYVNKVIPEKIFKLTWVPEKCRYTDKKKELKKKYLNFKLIEDLVK